MTKRSVGPALRHYWTSLSPLPGGKWIFSRLLGTMVPYTATVGARIERLEPGYCKVRLKDRRRVRNHLQSIHAMALCNLGEVTSGLALLNGLPEGMRGILKSFEIEYFKKSKGTLVAESHCTPPSDKMTDCEIMVSADIRDAENHLTATAHANWLIGSLRP